MEGAFDATRQHPPVQDNTDRCPGTARQRVRLGDPDRDHARSPAVESLRFRCASDVVAWASIDFSLGRNTWPEIWHLDNSGKLHCLHRGSSLDSVRAWAANPEPLLRPRTDELSRLTGCPDRWVVIDSRPSSRYPPPAVVQADVEAFEQLRLLLATITVVLLDVVIFDDDYCWWSLHEITTGSTEWPVKVEGS